MGLTERQQRTTELSYWEGEIPLRYKYTFGIAGEAFFQALKNKGVLLAARCPACGKAYLPPRIYCEACFAEIDPASFFDAGLRGTLHSWTACYENMDGSRKEHPTLLGIIRINGTDGSLYHRLGEVREKNLRMEMAMEAVLVPKRDRKGGIEDIRYFKPVKR